MNSDILMVAVMKGDDRYIFLYREETRAEFLRTLGKFACNPDLNLTWYDAAKICLQAKKARTDVVNVRIP